MCPIVVLQVWKTFCMALGDQGKLQLMIPPSVQRPDRNTKSGVTGSPAVTSPLWGPFIEMQVSSARSYLHTNLCHQKLFVLAQTLFSLSCVFPAFSGPGGLSPDIPSVYLCSIVTKSIKTVNISLSVSWFCIWFQFANQTHGTQDQN